MTALVALVTGAASGIGRHLVSTLARRGDRVIAGDIDAAALARAASDEGWHTDRVTPRTLDVRDPAAWEAALDAATGGLDALSNVAGVLKPGRVHEVSPADIALHVDVNVKGVMLGTSIAAARMVRQGRGHIINVSSLAGIAPVPGLTLYSATKFAVRGFSLAAAIDLAPLGVAVTVVCPDAVQTPMLDLQRGNADAALTFSGPRVLETGDVVAALLDALARRPVEITLPASRAALAHVASALPAVAKRLDPLLRRRGMKAQGRS